MHSTLLHRYTTEHPVEYVIVALFIWGLVDIGLKLMAFPKERWATRHDWFAAAARGRGRSPTPVSCWNPFSPSRSGCSIRKIGRRLVHALEHVEEKGSAEGFRDHLHYLADQDEDALHGSYTLTRFHHWPDAGAGLSRHGGPLRHRPGAACRSRKWRPSCRWSSARWAKRLTRPAPPSSQRSR